MASNDLGGQNKYAHDTITAILWWVFEINFFDKCNGFSVKRVPIASHGRVFRIQIENHLKTRLCVDTFWMQYEANAVRYLAEDDLLFPLFFRVFSFGI